MDNPSRNIFLFSVGTWSNVGARTVLGDYIRDVANLKGTKVVCREGGCGACTVQAKCIDPSGTEVIKSVNSVRECYRIRPFFVTY